MKIGSTVTADSTPKAKEPFEHRAMRLLKRQLKYSRKMSKAECAEYLRQLLKKQR